MVKRGVELRDLRGRERVAILFGVDVGVVEDFVAEDC